MRKIGLREHDFLSAHRLGKADMLIAARPGSVISSARHQIPDSCLIDGRELCLENFNSGSTLSPELPGRFARRRLVFWSHVETSLFGESARKQ